ncbi:MAG TPA: ABC transporter substrate-binding protein [Anaerolineales bacterium]|nr:ABC transporter substrate-binding protein [Anaerolineales bacterium]
MAVRVSRRAFSVLAVAALLAVALLPSAGRPTRAASPLVLRLGTTTQIQSLNPWQIVEEEDYEVMTLNYDVLVGWGPDLEPAAGFAESWTRSTDGKTWTFKIRDGMKWSDGQPATAEDARWTMQFQLDQLKKDGTVGDGYLDVYPQAAGVTSVSAPDPTTLVVTTNLPNSLILTSYVPILPEHVWSKLDPKAATTSFQNPAPIVGTGPYQVVEYKPGEYVRLARNPYYRGQQGAADEILMTYFSSPDTMVQALKKGDVDYARGVPAAQFDQLKKDADPHITAVEGVSNTFYELAFNCYDKPIPGGGASTTALADPAFRDALGYAIDKQALVDKIFGGHAAVGDTQLTPQMAEWHTSPPADQLRTFSIETANQKLLAAGYPLDASGRRLDKDGKPISLRLNWPGASEEAKAAQLIQAWFAQLGIKTTAAAVESAKLAQLILPPEADPPGKAQFDLFIWDWVGDTDPYSLLKVLISKEIGASSDSNWSNPQYDQLYDQQLAATSDTDRKAIIDQMQLLFYQQAPYHVLWYPTNLDAYRTDRFGGWRNQPTKTGVPFFGFGSANYTLLTDANAPTPSPTASGAAPPPTTPAASASPATPGSGGETGGGVPVALVVGGVGLVAVIAGILLLMRRRTGPDEEE